MPSEQIESAGPAPKEKKTPAPKRYVVHRTIAVACVDKRTRQLRPELASQLDSLLSPKQIDRLVKAGFLSIQE